MALALALAATAEGALKLPLSEYLAVAEAVAVAERAAAEVREMFSLAFAPTLFVLATTPNARVSAEGFAEREDKELRTRVSPAEAEAEVEVEATTLVLAATTARARALDMMTPEAFEAPVLVLQLGRRMPASTGAKDTEGRRGGAVCGGGATTT